MSRALHAEIRKRFAETPGSAAFDLTIQFEAPPGITTLFGPSGSGKSLTLESVAGFSRPDAGSVRLGTETFFDSERRVNLPARRRRCGYLFQRDALFPHMTVRENLEFAARSGREGDLRSVGRLLERFRIAHLASRRPREISGGERQRCAIARTLAGKPRLLLMDEPAQGLDIALRRELRGIIAELRQELAGPLLLVTHDLTEALALGDQMLVYSDGRIVQRGEPHAVYRQPASSLVARLLGLDNIFEGQLRENDPERGVGAIDAAGLRIPAQYQEGLEPGAPVEVCVRSEVLRVRPRNGAAPPGAAVLELQRTEELADRALLIFAGGLTARTSLEDFQRAAGAREWTVEFPSGSVWIFPASRLTS